MLHGRRLAVFTQRQTFHFIAIALFLLAVSGSLPVQAAEHVSRLTITTRTGAHVFTVEEAASESERERGLMYRRVLPDDRGMLFIFPETQPVVFWMKNTPVALDMLFISADGTIAGIAANAEPMSEAMIRSPEPVRFVLELNGGMSARIGAVAGDRVRNRLILPKVK